MENKQSNGPQCKSDDEVRSAKSRAWYNTPARTFEIVPFELSY